MTTSSNMTRFGIVSSSDEVNKKARVYFPDQDNMVSGWLYVLKHDADWMPAVNDRVVVLYSEGEDTDGYILGVIQ